MRLPIFFFALCFATPVWAAEFTVNNTVDAVDSNPGDGICADAAGECTLRAAVMETNALPGADVIYLPAGRFQLAIPGANENAAATGDLDITDTLELLGTSPDETIVDAAGLDQVFDIRGDVLMASLTITGGGGPPEEWPPEVLAAAGGIFNQTGNLRLVNVRVVRNSGYDAGGIYSGTGSTVLLYTEVTANKGFASGGIYQLGGTLQLEGSLVAGNEGSVGAIRSEGVYYTGPPIGGKSLPSSYCLGPAPVLVSDTAITGNKAVPYSIVPAISGGIGDADCGGPLHLVNSTVTGNEGGGIAWRSPYSFSAFLRNSIVANQGAGPDCSGSGSYVSNGFNLDSDGTCGLTAASDKPSSDPMLGPLQDNGGPWPSRALLPGSPAINAIPAASCTYDDDNNPATPEVAVTHDQRGVRRPQLGACDIGAYEVTQCGDGINNDSDAYTDLADPGCRDAASLTESPQCQDGIDNDPKSNDGIDFDGGVSVLGYAAGPPDPQCVGKPWKNSEACGVGFELVLILPGLMWLRRRMRRGA